MASKFQVSHVTIRNQWRDMKINYLTKQKAPKYTDQQLEETLIRARRLHRLLSDNDFELGHGRREILSVSESICTHESWVLLIQEEDYFATHEVQKEAQI